MSWLADLATDIRFGWRVLRRSPGFTVVALLTLALGIGANTAMFSVADGLMLRPPPFDHAERLYWVFDVNARLRLTVADAVPDSPANFLDWRRERRAFDGIVGWRNWFFSVAGAGGHTVAAEQLRGVEASPGFFEMLGVGMSQGRTFHAGEEAPGHDGVVVLTYGFWQRHFGGDTAIVGQPVLVDGRPRIVIGVLPKDFYFLFRDTAIFVPMRVDADFQTARDTHSMGVLVRLAPGMTRGDGQSDLDRISSDLARAYPSTNDGWSGALVPVFPLNRNLRPALLLLLGAVAFLLLIACINVGNLLLARAEARQRELAVRTALGASRGRLVRQMLAESALLATTGALVAVPMAAAALKILAKFVPDVRIAGAGGITIDARVLGVTTALTFVTAALLGTLPAARTSRTEQLRVSGDSHPQATVGNVLMTIEVALSLMLLFGATLLVRSLWNLERVDPGFRPDGLTTMQLWLPKAKYPDASAVSHFQEELLRRVHEVPDVTRAAVVNTRPFLGWALGARLQAPGRPSAGDDDPIVDFRIVSTGYLETLGARLIRGRNIEDRDGPNGAPVALVNRTMARRFWPTGNPIGDAVRLRLLGSKESAPWWPERTADAYTVVGVTSDIKENRLGDDVRPVVYLSSRQSPSRYAHLLVRTSGRRLNVTEVVQQELRSVDADLGVYDVESMVTVLDQAVASPRLNSTLLWIFAAIALALCAVGIYGVTSYVVARRTREFAIRLAMGAPPSTILRMVGREGAAVAVAGIAAGVGGALMLARTLETLVYGVEPADRVTLVAASVVVFLVVLTACWRPAARATKVDPMVVLRAE